LEATLLGQQFQFINCHLAAHQKESNERNQTIVRIIDELVHKDLQTDIIFLGDFNYRIEMEEKEYK
jgi:endonuclease/exonuclease/phosphatase family metal-dependent hydrolase